LLSLASELIVCPALRSHSDDDALGIFAADRLDLIRRRWVVDLDFGNNSESTVLSLLSWNRSLVLEGLRDRMPGVLGAYARQHFLSLSRIVQVSILISLRYMTLGAMRV
jgi:hypothetical protein